LPPVVSARSDDARHANRASADNRVHEPQRLAVDADEAFRSRRRRRCFAPVVRDKSAPARVVHEHECHHQRRSTASTTFSTSCTAMAASTRCRLAQDK
jgi:hypothetical protein